MPVNGNVSWIRHMSTKSRWGGSLGSTDILVHTPLDRSAHLLARNHGRNLPPKPQPWNQVWTSTCPPCLYQLHLYPLKPNPSALQLLYTYRCVSPLREIDHTHKSTWLEISLQNPIRVHVSRGVVSRCTGKQHTNTVDRHESVSRLSFCAVDNHWIHYDASRVPVWWYTQYTVWRNTYTLGRRRLNAFMNDWQYLDLATDHRLHRSHSQYFSVTSLSHSNSYIYFQAEIDAVFVTEFRQTYQVFWKSLRTYFR